MLYKMCSVRVNKERAVAASFVGFGFQPSSRRAGFHPGEAVMAMGWDILFVQQRWPSSFEFVSAFLLRSFSSAGMAEPTVAEPEVIALDESYEECPQNASFALVGKILSSKILNKTGVSRVIEKAWRTKEEFSISPWKDNIYAFGFKKEEDLCRVISRGPWSVMGSLLILRKWDQKKSFSELDFNFSPFWVQVHGLPLGFLNSKVGLTIARSLGEVIAVEEPGEKGRLANFLRVRVWVDITKPFKKGFFLRRPLEGDSCVRYKYERLSDFCYGCGVVGHAVNECKDKRSFDVKTWGFDGSIRAESAVIETINYGDQPLQKLVYPEGDRHHQRDEDGGACAGSSKGRVEGEKDNSRVPDSEERRGVEERWDGRTNCGEKDTLHVETIEPEGGENIPNPRRISLLGSQRNLFQDFVSSVGPLNLCWDNSGNKRAQYYVEEPDSPREPQMDDNLGLVEGVRPKSLDIDISMLSGPGKSVGLKSGGEEGLVLAFNKNVEKEDGGSSEAPLRSNVGLSKARGRRERGRRGGRSRGGLSRGSKIEVQLHDSDLVDINVGVDLGHHHPRVSSEGARDAGLEEGIGEKALVAGLKQPQVQW
ncbi:hypothetical protein RHSIM_Rhsim04G0047100 [Rhododendron simsii]|uniref:CCHC-type domain-containing protein n=1 Tax=Rhododendron simsii TaxID=118357 RepID=A0A834GZK6_RHOSS|nr:hypothetical protein RHSIM_Rhsim04G0047100 [Rhododendron simsii]